MPASNHPDPINATTARYCYLDIDIDRYRSSLATTAAFVQATDTRYGLSSGDWRFLGGSERSRLPELVANDHEWSSKFSSGNVSTENQAAVITAPPPPGEGMRLIVRLDWETAPIACENFATLCHNGSTQGKNKRPAPIGTSGKPLTYRNTVIHRVVPGFIVQGGDLVFGNGTGGESIYGGKKFKDERAGLSLSHNTRGILSMGNAGKNANTSQFFFTFAPAPQCNGKHVIFGELLSGWQILDQIEAFGNKDAGSGEEPSRPLVITDCGLWEPFSSTIPAAGYWYDQADSEAYSGVSPMFVVRPRVAVLAPPGARDKFRRALQPFCTVRIAEAEDCATDEKEVLKVKVVDEWLSTFAIDVVVVAPAWQQVAPTGLPVTWNGRGPAVSNVVFIVKPVEALERVQSSSWVTQTKGWHFDGIL